MRSPSSVPGITDCGLPGINPIVHGSHLCHFYPSRQELIESLVPFFQAGLRNNERCLWVTADPLPAAEAKMELARVVPDMQERIAAGELRIADGPEWYQPSGDITAEALVGRWLDEEAAALRAGYSGLRITGNASFLTTETWRAGAWRVSERDEWAASWSQPGERYMAKKDSPQAWLYYSFARWPVPNSPGKQKAYEKALEAYQQYAKKYDPPLEVLRVPYEGSEVVGYLRMPKNAKNVPFVIAIAGLDSRKEEMIERFGPLAAAAIGGI